VFAAKAGAKHVYAIEASGLAGKARENIVKNGLEDKITYAHILSQKLSLPD
jgi:protein arginine N-methyltransferase 3